MKQDGVLNVVGTLGPVDQAGIVARLLFRGKTMRGIFDRSKRVGRGD